MSTRRKTGLPWPLTGGHVTEEEQGLLIAYLVDAGELDSHGDVDLETQFIDWYQVRGGQVSGEVFYKALLQAAKVREQSFEDGWKAGFAEAEASAPVLAASRETSTPKSEGNSPVAKNWTTSFGGQDQQGNARNITIGTRDHLDHGKWLMVRFRGFSLELWIDWNTEVGHSIKPQVGWRIDNRPRRRRRRRGWVLSTDHQATFMPGDEVMDMVMALSDADSLSIQVHPFGRNPISASFAVSDFAEAVEPLLEALRQEEERSEARNRESTRLLLYGS